MNEEVHMIEIDKDKEQQLMTPRMLAAKLRVSTRTIRRLTSSGRIPVVRIGRLARYDASLVIAALALEADHEA